MARLRLLFALLLMSVGTWYGAFAISGYYEPQAAMPAMPATASVGQSAPPDASRFISPVSRERFVAVQAPAAAAPTNPKAAKPVAKAKPPAVDKRPQRASAQLPWPLSLIGN